MQIYRFLKCSNLNDLRDAFDPSQTYEGDNNVLLEQAAMTLLHAYNNSNHCQSFEFMNYSKKSFIKWNDDAIRGEQIFNIYNSSLNIVDEK